MSLQHLNRLGILKVYEYFKSGVCYVESEQDGSIKGNQLSFFNCIISNQSKTRKGIKLKILGRQKGQDVDCRTVTASVILEDLQKHM